MSNFFAEDVATPQNGNYFADTVASVPINDNEIDVIHRTNSPLKETPSSFGLVDIPVDFTAGIFKPVAELPAIGGGLLVETGELTKGMQGKSTIDIAKQSFTKRIIENMKEEDFGVKGVLQSVWGAQKDALLSLFSDGTVPEVMQNAGNAMVAQNQAALDALGISRKGGTSVAYDVGNAFGQVALTVGLTFARKNPKVAAGYMTALINTQDYAEARKAGKDPEEAASIAAASAYGQGLIELLGGKVFLGAAAGSSLLRKVIIRSTGQSAEEATQGVVEESIKGISGVRDTGMQEKITNIGYQAMLGFVAGVPISAVVSKIEEGGKAAGLDDAQIKDLADNLVKNKDEIIDAATVIIDKEAAGLTNDAPAKAETLKAVKQVFADDAALEEQMKKGGTQDPQLAAKMILKSPDTSLETKAAIANLGDNYTMDELKAAVDGLKVESAARANEAITPIMEQEKAEQQKQIANIQAETDDISTNLLREVTALQESKAIVDPDVLGMLENTRALLQEQRTTPKPVSLIAFLKSKGGIRDNDARENSSVDMFGNTSINRRGAGGELETMGMKNRAKNGARNDKTGLDLDMAREAAAEAGYIDMDSTVADFLVAVENDFKSPNSVIAEQDVGNQSKLDEIDNILSKLDKELGDKDVTYNRNMLKDLRRRVAANRKVDKRVAREIKAREAELNRLESDKRAVAKSPPAILANKLKTFISGLREGTYLGRKEAADVQNILIDMIERSGIDAAERAQFIRIIKNTQTIEQLQTKLPEIVKRVERLLEKSKRSAIVSHIKKVVDSVKDSNVIAVDFAKQIQSLVNEIDTSKRTEKTINSLQKTLDYMQRNPDAEMPKRILKKLEILNKKPLEDITTQELQDISDAIDTLVKRGKLKLTLLENQKERLKEKRIEELQKSSVPLSDRSVKKAKIGERLSIMDRIKNKYIEKRNRASRLGLATNPMDVFFDMLDGDKNYKGANHKIFKQAVDKSFSKYLDLKESVTREVKNLSDKLNLSEQSFEKIGAWAVLQQEGGEKKLLDSGITQGEIDGLSLNEDEIKMYQLMRKKLDSMLPAIQEVMRDVYNKDVVAVSDYFPFMTDHEAAKDFEIQDQLGPNVPSIGKKKNVEKGFTISRTGGSQKIRIDALGVFLRHVDNAAYLIEMGGDIKSLGDVAQSSEYGEAVGDVGQEMVVEWINLLARKGNLPGRIHAIDALRRNTGFAVLGYKLSTVLIQPTAMLDGASMIGGNYVSDGAIKVGTSREWRQFLWDNFPEVRERAGDDPAYLDMGGKGIVGDVREAGFFVLKKVDAFAASSVAAGAYTKSVEERGGVVDLSNPDPVAIQEAQLMMRRTQSSGFAKDSPALLTQGELTGNTSVDKLIFQFQSFMLNRWSLIKHDMWALGIKKGDVKKSLNSATWLILAMAAEVGIRRLSKELVAALTGDDTKPWEDTITKEAVMTVLGNVPFVSQTVGSFEYGSVPVPSISMLTQIGERLKWAAQSKSESKKAQHYSEAAILLMGTGFGVPGTLQAEQLLRGSMKDEKKKSKLSTP